MTLQECIARHEAAQPERIVLTPRAAAHVAGRAFIRALAALDPQDRTTVLAQTVVGIEGPAGETYSLLMSCPPVRDPELA